MDYLISHETDTSDAANGFFHLIWKHARNAAHGLFHITWEASNWNCKRMHNTNRLFSHRMKTIRERCTSIIPSQMKRILATLQTAFFMSNENHPRNAAHGLFHIKRNASNRNCKRMKNINVLCSYRIQRIRGKLHIDYSNSHETDRSDAANALFPCQMKSIQETVHTDCFISHEKHRTEAANVCTIKMDFLRYVWKYLRKAEHGFTHVAW
jgi:hypothetical protein